MQQQQQQQQQQLRTDRTDAADDDDDDDDDDEKVTALSTAPTCDEFPRSPGTSTTNTSIRTIPRTHATPTTGVIAFQTSRTEETTTTGLSFQTGTVETYVPSSSGRRSSRGRLSRAMRGQRSTTTKNDWVETFSPSWNGTRTKRPEAPAAATNTVGAPQTDEEQAPKQPLRTGTTADSVAIQQHKNAVEDALVKDSTTVNGEEADNTILAPSNSNALVVRSIKEIRCSQIRSSSCGQNETISV